MQGQSLETRLPRKNFRCLIESFNTREGHLQLDRLYFCLYSTYISTPWVSGLFIDIMSYMTSNHKISVSQNTALSVDVIQPTQPSSTASSVLLFVHGLGSNKVRYFSSFRNAYCSIYQFIIVVCTITLYDYKSSDSSIRLLIYLILLRRLHGWKQLS
jgi:hypothetical protein